MNGEERRIAILDKLSNTEREISASKLATEFSVTRQIIVADIALLRASGHPISAKSRGYFLERVNDGFIKRIAVKHGKENLFDELCAIVDNGGKIIDVIVEHSIYGKISAELNISSRYDINKFIEKASHSDAKPISELTEGLHIHTIDAKDEDTYKRIVKALSDLGILVETD